MTLAPETLRLRDASAAAVSAAALEAPLATLEERLVVLGQALQQPDADAVDRAAHELHAALAAAVDHFRRAAKSGGVPSPLRRRLALVGAQVAAQREALVRASASLDRAIDVLMPRPTAPMALYSSGGGSDRARQAYAAYASTGVLA